MERDVELTLTRQMAAIEATLQGFAKDATRRLDRIEVQTTMTNGRVDKLEQQEVARVRFEQHERDMRNALPPLNWHTVQKLGEFGGWLVAAVLAWLALAGKF